jgi:hypothetical protein
MNRGAIMPLHDWSKLPEWDGVHHMWITELYHDIKAKLPPGYRAGVATVPSLTVGGTSVHPDVNVQRLATPPLESVETAVVDELAYEPEVSLLAIDASTMIQIFRGSNLVAALEIISPGNKDRESIRKSTVDRFVGYLALGIHLTFVDVHAQPLKFSLADSIARDLDFPQPSCPAPQAISYRVLNGPDRGRSLAVRRAPLVIGDPLPMVPLSISQSQRVAVDLETTYSKATSDYFSWLPAINGTANGHA